MPLTRDFRVTIRERLERDPGFREALLEEGVQCLLAGVLEAAKGFRRLKGHADMPQLVAALRARDQRLGLKDATEVEQVA